MLSEAADSKKKCICANAVILLSTGASIVIQLIEVCGHVAATTTPLDGLACLTAWKSKHVKAPAKLLSLLDSMEECTAANTHNREKC